MNGSDGVVGQNAKSIHNARSKSRSERLLEAVDGRSRTPFGDQDLGRIRGAWIKMADAALATPFIKQNTQRDKIGRANRRFLSPKHSPHNSLRSDRLGGYHWGAKLQPIGQERLQWAAPDPPPAQI